MRLCVLPSVMLVCVILPLGARGDDLAKAKERLQGTWAMINVEHLGDTHPRNLFAGMTVTFKGDTMTLKHKEEVPFTYTLDLPKEPSHLDMAGKDDKGKEVTYPGIFKYDVDGFLVLCYTTASEKRPKEFKTGRSPELADCVIYALKRD